MRKNRGSYTLEAAILIPALIFIMAESIHIAIDFYHEIRQESEQQEEKLWMVERFYHLQGLKEILDNGT